MREDVLPGDERRLLKSWLNGGKKSAVSLETASSFQYIGAWGSH